MIESYEWFRYNLKKYIDKSEYIRGYYFDKKIRVAYLLVYGSASKASKYFKDSSKFREIIQAGKSAGWRVVLDDAVFSNYRVNYKKLYKLSENDMEGIQFRMIGLAHSYSESSENVYMTGVVSILISMWSWYLGESPSSVCLEDLIKNELLAPEMPSGIKELLIPTLDYVTRKEYTESNVISVFDCCELFSLLIKMKIFKAECLRRGVDIE